MNARPQKNAQRQLNRMLDHVLFVQMAALSFAGLSLAEHTRTPVTSLYRDHLRAALQNALSVTGMVDAEASALTERFIERVQTLADDMVSIMTATATQEVAPF
ncbi:hypothetical protein OIV19_03425 [Brucella sp. HL-2]|nr:hypothetical protein [Brucella sp. HL-2]MCV9906666.1 hypothetical protein [Brucella sp. HL-2]